MINNLLIRLVGLSINQVGLVCVLAAAGYYFILYDNGNNYTHQISSLKEQIIREKQKENKADQLKKEFDEVEKTKNDLNEKSHKIEKLAQKKINMGELIRLTDELALASGIALKEKEPKGLEKVSIFNSITLKIVGTGRFQEVVIFLQNIGRSESLLRVMNFQIYKDQESSDDVTLTADVVALHSSANEKKEDNGDKGGNLGQPLSTGGSNL